MSDVDRVPDLEIRPLVPVRVLFYGGLDLVFKGQHEITVSVPTLSPANPTPATKATEKLNATLGTLIQHLASEYALPHKKNLFFKDGSVTPGILVLVNDADWELEGKEDCELKADDEVVFVSTLHGG